MNHRRNKNRKGFTLMEILLVVAILVAMASMATFAYVSIKRNADIRNTQTEVRLLAEMCTMFHSSVNSFPTTLRDLQVIPQGLDQNTWGGPYMDARSDFLDVWNIEYKYAVDDANFRVVITSAGPDRQFNTADDISN
jgi:general secretion pathway protein G